MRHFPKWHVALSPNPSVWHTLPHAALQPRCHPLAASLPSPGHPIWGERQECIRLQQIRKLRLKDWNSSPFSSCHSSLINIYYNCFIFLVFVVTKAILLVSHIGRKMVGNCNVPVGPTLPAGRGSLGFNLCFSPTLPLTGAVV